MRRTRNKESRWTDVLCYDLHPVSRATVRRHYARWREAQGIPARCDMPECEFHRTPLVWRGDRLPLILDHANGNRFDNSPQNLRYVCPNCDSQLSTRGGRNRGRVSMADSGSYLLLDRSGRTHLHLIPKTGSLTLTGFAPTVVQGPRTQND